MADEIKTEVRQESYSVEGEGSQGKLRLNRRGEVITPDWYQQLVADGRVYVASNAARETAEAIGTATTWSDTDPALLLDIPEGKTVIPLEILLNQGGTVAGGAITVLITLSDKIRYSSGGVLLAPKNMRFDASRTSGCSFYTGSTDIVAAANSEDITLYATILDQDVATIPSGIGTRVHWTARQYLAPELIGPASLVIYAVAGTTQPSFFYTVKYAAFDTTEVKQV